MNKELEALILAYEKASASRDKDAERVMQDFEKQLDDAMDEHPGISRDVLRKAVIKKHRQWALKQDNKPPIIPPKA